MTAIIFGIDVSKQNLDVFDSHFQKHIQFFNTTEGIEELIQHYSSFGNKRVIIESTGNYQRLVHHKLEQAGFAVSIVNPHKTRCFAKASGFLAKTDKVDAKMLWTYGQKVECRITPCASPTRQELESLVHYKNLLQEELKRLINQQEYDHPSSLVKTLIIRQIDELKHQLKQIEKRINELLDEDKDFKNKKEILQTVPGVGIGTIASLLCYLPEYNDPQNLDH